MPATQTHSSACSHYSTLLFSFSFAGKIFYPCKGYITYITSYSCKSLGNENWFPSNTTTRLMVIDSIWLCSRISRFSLKQQSVMRIRNPASKEQHWSWSHPHLMWMYEQVRPAAETGAMSLSTWPTAPAGTDSTVCPQAMTTTHKECPMCYITNERSNINVHHRLSEQALNHSQCNVFHLRGHPESAPDKLCFLLSILSRYSDTGWHVVWIHL